MLIDVVRVNGRVVVAGRDGVLGTRGAAAEAGAVDLANLEDRNPEPVGLGVRSHPRERPRLARNRELHDVLAQPRVGGRPVAVLQIVRGVVVGQRGRRTRGDRASVLVTLMSRRSTSVAVK